MDIETMRQRLRELNRMRHDSSVSRSALNDAEVQFCKELSQVGLLCVEAVNLDCFVILDGGEE